MAHAAANGFIARAPDGDRFVVYEKVSGRKKVEHKPGGVFVHGDHRAGVFMNYAGFSSSSMTFSLPTDASYLRDIAEAITMMADQIDERRAQGY